MLFLIASTDPCLSPSCVCSIYLHRERVRSPTHVRGGSMGSVQSTGNLASLCHSDGVSPTNELNPQHNRG